ncbi:hypothetical protein MSG28_014475 [Choristoneura fumiferana]|uniref:Uncharacterized protein n=1 Tax=Choristoneura fumiferana TaxID=7141 RepID=A0ACC0JRJ0_CHOFU|nr:hypothetical protein MSG28_014475 [Choristoneura fumiferana]
MESEPNMQEELNERCIRYMRCGLLNVIQHIVHAVCDSLLSSIPSIPPSTDAFILNPPDIYGKTQSSYAEPRRSRRAPPTSVAMNSCPRLVGLGSLYQGPSKMSLETRLSKMSTTTKTSSLYPGHDILSRRRRLQQGKELVCNAVVPRS